MQACWCLQSNDFMSNHISVQENSLSDSDSAFGS